MLPFASRSAARLPLAPRRSGGPIEARRAAQRLDDRRHLPAHHAQRARSARTMLRRRSTDALELVVDDDVVVFLNAATSCRATSSRRRIAASGSGSARGAAAPAPADDGGSTKTATVAIRRRAHLRARPGHRSRARDPVPTPAPARCRPRRSRTGCRRRPPTRGTRPPRRICSKRGAAHEIIVHAVGLVADAAAGTCRSATSSGYRLVATSARRASSCRCPREPTR